MEFTFTNRESIVYKLLAPNDEGMSEDDVACVRESSMI